jgi:hypothetical protein
VHETEVSSFVTSQVSLILGSSNRTKSEKIRFSPYVLKAKTRGHSLNEKRILATV